MSGDMGDMYGGILIVEADLCHYVRVAQADNMLSALLLPPAEVRRADAAVGALQHEGGVVGAWLATRSTAPALWAMVVLLVLAADSLAHAFNLYPDEPCDGLVSALLFVALILANVRLALHTLLGHLIKRRGGNGHASEPAVIVLFDDLAAFGFEGVCGGLSLLIFSPSLLLYQILVIGFAFALVVFLCISAALRACMRGRSRSPTREEEPYTSAASSKPADSTPV